MKKQTSSDSSNEKVPYPPAYTEIYPAVPVPVIPGQNMGWQQPAPVAAEVVMPDQPPVYVSQHPVSNVVLRNQSRIGLYPVKLQPCPNCHQESTTTIKQVNTIRTHILAAILCAACCCLCIPCVYMSDNMTKTANHFCGKCNAYIGSYKRKLCS